MNTNVSGGDTDWDPGLYRFDFPDVPLYKGPLVGMPLIHKLEKVREYLAEVLTEARTSLRFGAELPALLTGLAVIDYLAGFYVGRQSKKNDYVAFMRRYFPTAYQPLLEPFYDNLRCGLMHNLVATNPWKHSNYSFFIEARRPDHLAALGRQTVLSVLTFLEDVRRAWWKYAHDLVMRGEANPAMVVAFSKRFDRLEGIGAFMVKLPDAQRNATQENR